MRCKCTGNFYLIFLQAIIKTIIKLSKIQLQCTAADRNHLYPGPNSDLNRFDSIFRGKIESVTCLKCGRNHVARGSVGTKAPPPPRAHAGNSRSSVEERISNFESGDVPVLSVGRFTRRLQSSLPGARASAHG